MPFDKLRTVSRVERQRGKSKAMVLDETSQSEISNP
jgi:hypothetical protein